MYESKRDVQITMPNLEEMSTKLPPPDQPPHFSVFTRISEITEEFGSGEICVFTRSFRFQVRHRQTLSGGLALGASRLVPAELLLRSCGKRWARATTSALGLEVTSFFPHTVVVTLGDLTVVVKAGF